MTPDRKRYVVHPHLCGQSSAATLAPTSKRSSRFRFGAVAVSPCERFSRVPQDILGALDTLRERRGHVARQQPAPCLLSGLEKRNSQQYGSSTFFPGQFLFQRASQKVCVEFRTGFTSACNVSSWVVENDHDHVRFRQAAPTIFVELVSPA